MMRVGIHRLSMSTTAYAIKIEELAAGHQIDAQKYISGLGQREMSVPTPLEDHISLGVDAALHLLNKEPAWRNKIDLLIWATESATDYSKAASVFAHQLLGLKPECRSIELKQACYAGVFGLRTAANFIKTGQACCALVIASDIARYQLQSPAESSQGAAAAAFIVHADPDLFLLSDSAVYATQDVRDFYRPLGATEPIVDGKYSCMVYLKMLDQLWQSLPAEQKENIAAFCCHTPLPKLAEKAVSQLKISGLNDDCQQQILRYQRLIGNSYTASLFISLCSLLDNTALCDSASEQNILCYSYGSGATAELFTLILQPQSQHYRCVKEHQMIFEKRQYCDFEQYVAWHHNYYTSSVGPTFNLDSRTLKISTDQGYPRYELANKDKEICGATAMADL